MLDEVNDKLIVAVSLERYELLTIEASFIVCRCYESLKSHDSVVLSKIVEGFDHDWLRNQNSFFSAQSVRNSLSELIAYAEQLCWFCHLIEINFVFFLLSTVSVIPYRSLILVFELSILIIFHLILVLLKCSISAEQSDCEIGLCGTANLSIELVLFI